MKKRFCFVMLVAAIVFPSFFSTAFSADKEKFSITPKTNSGKMWRIGYLEGGPYANYPANLTALVNALAEIGWVEKTEFPHQADKNDSSNLWAWIASNLKSKKVQFVRDAFWSCNWDKAERPKIKAKVIERLNRRKDIDLMLAMGTWAGQDLASNEHSVPTIVMSSSNAVRSKIIKSIEDSGYDHVNARVDPTRYERMVRIFHDIIGFKKLGIAYEQDTVDGRTYAGIEDVKKVAKERGFEIVSCHAPFSDVSKEEAAKAVLKCHQELAPKVDAFYITVHRGVTREGFSKLLVPLNKHKLPTFSQLDSREVRIGALLSISRAGFKYIAKFHAETIAKIFNGAKPRDLEQVFEDPPRIAINLQAAQIIGYDPPVDLLGAADEIYEQIESVK